MNYRSHRKFVRIDFYLGLAITRLKPDLFRKSKSNLRCDLRQNRAIISMCFHAVGRSDVVGLIYVVFH